MDHHHLDDLHCTSVSTKWQYSLALQLTHPQKGNQKMPQAPPQVP
jgi:hypothetical protein